MTAPGAPDPYYATERALLFVWGEGEKQRDSNHTTIIAWTNAKRRDKCLPKIKRTNDVPEIVLIENCVDQRLTL